VRLAPGGLGQGQEAGDVRQAAVVRDGGEVGADRDRALGPVEMPREAHPVVVGVGAVDEFEVVAGELLLDAADHRGDPVGPLARDMRIEVSRVGRVGLLDERAAALRVGLVPAGDVGVDGVRDVGHGAALCATIGRRAITSEVMAGLTAARYGRAMTVGPLLREWRERRRMSQLELALEAGVSTRHVSFVETGRSRPSVEMVLHLAEQLDVPLRDRDAMLLAAGYAPAFGERDLEAPEMSPVREAIELVLEGHEPYPAAVVDRGWNLVAGNSAIALLTASVAPDLLEPPVNVLRISLHPRGMAPRIANLAEWRQHLLHRLRRQVQLTGDNGAAELLAELESYPVPDEDDVPHNDIVVPLRLRDGLSFFSTVTTFGTAIDITVSELAIESFFPADTATAESLRG
jgi:transcriptional regulator with XRE-family HTH domain